MSRPLRSVSASTTSPVPWTVALTGVQFCPPLVTTSTCQWCVTGLVGSAVHPRKLVLTTVGATNAFGFVVGCALAAGPLADVPGDDATGVAVSEELVGVVGVGDGVGLVVEADTDRSGLLMTYLTVTDPAGGTHRVPFPAGERITVLFATACP